MFDSGGESGIGGVEPFSDQEFSVSFGCSMLLRVPCRSRFHCGLSYIRNTMFRT